MDRPRIVVSNFTNYFHKELFMYALGDIKFQKPVSLRKVAYTTLFFIIWTMPWYFVIGLPTNPYKAIFMIGIPVVAGHFASKPVWGGKSLTDYVKTLFVYWGQPKGWADLKPINEHGVITYHTENDIWISRRRELKALQENRLENL